MANLLIHSLYRPRSGSLSLHWCRICVRNKRLPREVYHACEVQNICGTNVIHFCCICMCMACVSCLCHNALVL